MHKKLRHHIEIILEKIEHLQFGTSEKEILQISKEEPLSLNKLTK